jgi:hypothetical protein
MTIAEIVKQFGLPVRVRRIGKDEQSWPSFIIHSETDDGWLADYANRTNQTITNVAYLDDYEVCE